MSRRKKFLRGFMKKHSFTKDDGKFYAQWSSEQLEEQKKIADEKYNKITLESFTIGYEEIIK